jgi:hypothetical protein
VEFIVTPLGSSELGVFSVYLCVLCASVVKVIQTHHRDTENTEIHRDFRRATGSGLKASKPASFSRLRALPEL